MLRGVIKKGVNCKVEVKIMYQFRNHPSAGVLETYTQISRSHHFLLFFFKSRIKSTKNHTGHRPLPYIFPDVGCSWSPQCNHGSRIKFTIHIHIDRWQRQRHPLKLARRGSHFLQRANLIDVPVLQLHQTHSHSMEIFFMWVCMHNY